MIKENVLNIKDEMIQEIINLVRYESVSIKSDNKEKPFGEECKKALEYILELGKKLGFNTKNVDGYCGYIEFGEGKELLGIIGHLDVVPALIEDGWTTPPFSITTPIPPRAVASPISPASPWWRVRSAL